MITPDYYYVIVGGGLAGLQLASRINKDLFFKGKKIAIIDPSEKTENDKTWCFWEKSTGNWDYLVHSSWKIANFYSSEISETLDLGDYTYKMIRSLDFYEQVKKELQEAEEITFIQDRVTKIDPVTRTAIGEKSKYTATHFFDSRVNQDYKTDEKSSLIYQHFKGWMIETPEDVFDPEAFTMMDYRLKYEDTTSFTYVLPVTPRKALVEFTFFTPYLTKFDVYEKMITKYLKEILKISNWKILETEAGVIPMTDFPFHTLNSTYITKIGTGGGWVKASSGYSFRNTEKKTAKIIENIKSGLAPEHGLFNKKFSKYDAIFLDVLDSRNDLGEYLFTELYTNNTVEEIFRFLDEETTFYEDLKIMFSLYHPQFIKSFFKLL